MEPETLGEYDIVAPGAFKHNVGKTVPVLDTDKVRIGTATVIDADGKILVRLDDSGTEYETNIQI